MTYNKYIGLPYRENGRDSTGIDCWGLACLYYKQELNIDLPSYAELYSGGLDPVISSLITEYKDNWLETTSPVVGDLCLFNIYGEPQHVGIYIGNNKFLHSREGKDSVIESLNSPQWKKRFVGFFKHTEQTIEVVGAPHPLRNGVIREWTVAGTTVADFVKFINTKYKVSTALAKKLVVMVDGVAIPQDKWDTTTLKQDQKIAYKVVPSGGNGFRLILTLALVVAAPYIAGYLATGTFTTAAAAAAAGTISTTTAWALTAGVQLVGMALINAIAPIRPPEQPGDPGQAQGLNLFTGAANQVNRFGAIPVVLGKLRLTGVLGATPYVETLTDSNLVHLLVVWGFGPLEITEINAGANELTEAYYDGLPESVPRPVTIYGTGTETDVEKDKFNALYPGDVEQQSPNIELVNNPDALPQNPWREVTFQQLNSDGIDLAFTFPEGMREVVTKGNDAGKVNETVAVIEIQTRSRNFGDAWSAWGSTTAFSVKNGDSTQVGSSKTLIAPRKFTYEEQGDTYHSITYKYYAICIAPGGGVEYLEGATTDRLDLNPSQRMIDNTKGNTYGSLLGSDSSSNYMPVIPQGYKHIYTITISSDTGFMANKLVNYLSNWGYTGLVLSYQNIESTDLNGDTIYSGTTKVDITGGLIYDAINPVPTDAVTQTIFETSSTTIPNSTNQGSAASGWSDLLKETGVWGTDAGDTWTSQTGTVNFPENGMYEVEAACDDYGKIYINGSEVINLPEGGWRSTVKKTLYFSAGTKTIQLVATNKTGEKSIGCRITLTKGTGSNLYVGQNNIISIGTGAYFPKRKDAFNYVYQMRDLPRNPPNMPGKQWAVRVRRVNDDTAEPLGQDGTSSVHKYHKAIFASAVAYDSTTPPMRDLPRGQLAKTAIRVQSTAKVNGQIDGINALVQTKTWDWDAPTNSWTFRPTNNPASLFLYVLTHSANAYRLADIDPYQPFEQLEVQRALLKTKVDLENLQEWHEYCDEVTPLKPQLTYNSVLTSTQSVMDTLRNICAAGKASPTLVDGKWKVVIDKPRPYVVQHFTPQNSWGFEATKVLPILPDAFRVTFPDEAYGYQANEIRVYNYGKTESTAEIFEELQLPGVTNEAQAIHLARWHLAQIKLRPEQYTFNTDFEYLVCNRGDLVKVTHDVPMWGNGSARIKTINGSVFTLTDSIFLEAGKQYRALIRTYTNTNLGNNVINADIAVVTETNYYSEITATNLTTGIPLEGDLVLIGEVGKETQELVVLKVEPSTNNSAKITLVDYSPEIYTADLENDLLAYSPNITRIGSEIISRTIVGVPGITSVISDRGTSQEISAGTYQTTAILSFTNPSGLNKNAELVQFELARGSELFGTGASGNTYVVNKNIGTITFTGLITGEIYKVRARYTNATGSTFGAWSSDFTFTAGESGIEPSIVQSVILDLANTEVVADLATYGNEPSDFKCYEYRLYRDTGTEDFWDIVPDVTNKIDVQQTLRQAKFDLRKQANPRISTQGVTYRVACRMVNRNNEYSAESALGTIVVKTIQ